LRLRQRLAVSGEHDRSYVSGRMKPLVVAVSAFVLLATPGLASAGSPVETQYPNPTGLIGETPPTNGEPPAGSEPAAGTEPPASTEPPGGTEPGGTEPGGTEPGGTEPGGTEPGGTEPGGTEPGGTEPPGSTGLPTGTGTPARTAAPATGNHTATPTKPQSLVGVASGPTHPLGSVDTAKGTLPTAALWAIAFAAVCALVAAWLVRLR
jgi:hypothetical protein